MLDSLKLRVHFNAHFYAEAEETTTTERTGRVGTDGFPFRLNAQRKESDADVRAVRYAKKKPIIGDFRICFFLFTTHFSAKCHIWS